VRTLAIDADYEDALDDLLKLQWELRRDGVEAALEKSGVALISGSSATNLCWHFTVGSTSTTSRGG